MTMTKSPDFQRIIPDGDDHVRDVCRSCGFIHYINPKLVVGAVITDDRGRFVMARRAIDPQKGLWTIPAGFMELGESPAEGAAREAMEEACAKITITDLLAVYTIPHISQVQMMYRATLDDPDIAPGMESLDVGLFDWDMIPWKDIAFPSVHWALRHYRDAVGKADFAPFTNPAVWPPKA